MTRLFREPCRDHSKTINHSNKKVAFDSKELKEVKLGGIAQVPNTEEVKSGILWNVSDGTESKILATKTDFDNAYGRMKMDEKRETYAYSS